MDIVATDRKGYALKDVRWPCSANCSTENPYGFCSLLFSVHRLTRLKFKYWSTMANHDQTGNYLSWLKDLAWRKLIVAFGGKREDRRRTCDRSHTSLLIHIFIVAWKVSSDRGETFPAELDTDAECQPGSIENYHQELVLSVRPSE